MTTTPLRLTPAEALKPGTVQRLAVAEFCYDRIMSGRLEPPPEWWLLTLEDQAAWQLKARELLADLAGCVTGDEERRSEAATCAELRRQLAGTNTLLAEAERERDTLARDNQQLQDMLRRATAAADMAEAHRLSALGLAINSDPEFIALRAQRQAVLALCHYASGSGDHIDGVSVVKTTDVWAALGVTGDEETRDA